MIKNGNIECGEFQLLVRPHVSDESRGPDIVCEKAAQNEAQPIIGQNYCYRGKRSPKITRLLKFSKHCPK
jgi:hypothetical protein